MAKKRSIFDIDFTPDTEVPEDLETKSFRNVQGHPMQNDHDDSPAPSRRGPMAAAITENANALEARSEAEAAIRAENDALAHEHVRLKKLGLITDLIPVDQVKSEKLLRDRKPFRDAEIDELKASIAAIGLSNPIRVEQTDDGFELIQGYRRLTAFRELLEDTGDDRYARIPAALVPRGEDLTGLYRKMVDENLIRRDISFGEMAELALGYSRDLSVEVEKAVDTLFASAGRQKRAYIKNFARLIAMCKGGLDHVEAIPRALGLELQKKLQEDGDGRPGFVERLKAETRDAVSEISFLRDYLKSAVPAGTAAKPTAKTTIKLARPEGAAKVTAADGKVELRLNRDFSALDRRRLEGAVRAFFDALDE